MIDGQFQTWVAYLRSLRGKVLLLAVLLFSGIAFQLANPQVIRTFLDTAAGGGDPQALIGAAVLFVCLSLGQRLLSLASSYLAQSVGWDATNDLRKDLMLHCLKLDMGFHKKHTPGELIERIDGDVNSLANYFSEFAIQVLGNGLLILGILALLFREHLILGAGLSLYTALAFVLLGLIQKLGVARWKDARQAAAEQYGFLEERIAGVEDIRSVGAEPYVLFRLHKLMRNFLQKTRSARLVANLSENLTGLLFAAGYGLGLSLGVYLYTRGSASIGTAYLVVYYTGMLAQPVQRIRHQLLDLQQASASLERVGEILTQESSIKSPAALQGGGLRGTALSLSFERVSFHYENDVDVLKDVSFHLAPRKVLGVLGRTGSGKSTLTRLLIRLYDPGGGSIYLDGHELRSIPLEELRLRVGMVTQEVQLFQASIRQNLTFFREDIPDETILKALKSLSLWSWFESLPEGLETDLKPGGQGLSAGEAQLLAFTRLFLKDPGLVILDEASSRLDPATEYLLERAIDRLLQNRTGIIIAHRLSTVQRADDILILEDGRVVEYGARTELSADPASRFYRLLRTGLEEVLA